MGIVRWWLGLTAVLLLGFLVWTFVPILVPMLVIAVALGVLATLVVGMARRLERARGDVAPETRDPATGSLRRRHRRRSDLPD